MSASDHSDVARQIQQERVAWRVTVDNMTCVTFASTAKAARCNAVLAAREAGYFRSGSWPTARAVRVPQWDQFPLRDDGEPRRVWSPEFVEDYP